LKHLRDIDATPTQCAELLKEELAPHLSTDRNVSDVGFVYDKVDWSFLKTLGDFYRSKGTPQAFEYFFRLLYGAEVYVKFPRTDIIRTSDGEWNNSYIIPIVVPW